MAKIDWVKDKFRPCKAIDIHNLPEIPTAIVICNSYGNYRYVKKFAPKPSRRLFYCQVCKDEFDSPYETIMHSLMVHKNYKCPYCKATMTFFEKVRQHFETGHSLMIIDEQQLKKQYAFIAKGIYKYLESIELNSIDSNKVLFFR